jgi:hypothetical protein
MKCERIKTGKCGTCPTFGGAVVSVENLNEFYATQQNTTANLMQVVASCDKKLYAKHGLKKFKTYDEAVEYAKGDKA